MGIAPRESDGFELGLAEELATDGRKIEHFAIYSEVEMEEGRLDSLIRKPARTAPGETKDTGRRPPAKKSTPPDQTNAEQFYYAKQMQSKTHMIVVLTDGEQLEGVIEWYDRECLKLNRIDAPNLLLFKRCIKYMYKAEPE